MTVTKIKAELNPTEDQEKVANAIVKIFGDIELDVSDDRITGELIGLIPLSTFRSRIASDKIKATLGNVIYKLFCFKYIRACADYRRNFLQLVIHISSPIFFLKVNQERKLPVHQAVMVLTVSDQPLLLKLGIRDVHPILLLL